MNKLVPVQRIGDEEFQVEFEILSPLEFENCEDPERKDIYQEIQSIDKQINTLETKIQKLDIEIDKLTNHADGLDYAIAVASGVITGLIDSFFIGEWNFERGKKLANKDVNNKVIKFVKKDPRYLPWCNGTNHGRKVRDPNRLDSAIEFLEEHYHLPGDSAYQTGKFGITGNNHRLDDFCHHPTLVGMICSIIVQFTGSTIYSHNSGEVIRIPIEVNQYGNFVGNNSAMKIMAGVINWFITCAKTIANQKGHLMSDIATSAGVPGPILSTLKELSALPCFKDNMFSENIRKAYQNGIGTGKNQIDLGVFNQLFQGADSKFDMRTEMAIQNELKRQAIPVIINEALVRGFYFVRRFIKQMRIQPTIADIDWKMVLPFNNRTIARMITIASGTFMTVDLADAAIRGAIKSGGNPAAFAKEAILRVNFVGIGRFVIAVATDVGMGIKRSKLRNERIGLYSEMLNLSNAKVFYLEAGMWLAAIDTQKVLDETWSVAEKSVMKFSECWTEIEDDMEDIHLNFHKITNDPQVAQDLLDEIL